MVWRCFWFSPQFLMLQQTWYFQFVSSTFRKARLCFVFIKQLYGETNLSHFSVEDRTPPGGTEPDLWLWSRPHHCWILTRVEPLKAADRETTLGFGRDQHVNDAENVILIWQMCNLLSSAYILYIMLFKPFQVKTALIRCSVCRRRHSTQYRL